MKRTILLAASAGVVMMALMATQASGFGSYFARVTANGGISRSSGVTNGANPTAGVYEITFSRAVNLCGYVATVNDTKAGYATINLKTTKILTITTFNAGGTKANHAFNVMVTCGG
jgi:hypothetical protein